MEATDGVLLSMITVLAIAIAYAIWLHTPSGKRWRAE